MSPYKSEAQRKFFHTNTAKKAGISKKVVKEFDTASKGKKLPEKVKKSPAKATNKTMKKENLKNKKEEKGESKKVKAFEKKTGKEKTAKKKK